MASKKREKLDALISSGRWATAPAIELELAVRDAFGYEMDARVIRFVFLRRNALQHIRYLRKCQLMLRVSEDGSCLEPAKRYSGSFRRRAVVASAAAFAPVLLLGAFSPFLTTHVPLPVLGMMSGFAFGWLPGMMWVADGLVTADRLTAKSSRYYPLDAEAPTTHNGKPAGDRTSSSKKEACVAG